MGLSGADPHRCVIADHHKSSSQLLVLVRSAPLAETWDPQDPCGQLGEEDPALLSKSLCSNSWVQSCPWVWKRMVSMVLPSSESISHAVTVLSPYSSVGWLV